MAVSRGSRITEVPSLPRSQFRSILGYDQNLNLRLGSKDFVFFTGFCRIFQSLAQPELRRRVLVTVYQGDYPT